MDFVLTILKFAGIIVSGTLGILGTLTQTHEEVAAGGKKKLNRWGKWAVGLTICASVTAFGAQLAEVLKKKNEDKEARKNTEEQLKQAREILNRLEKQAKESAAILTNVERQGMIADESRKKADEQLAAEGLSIRYIERLLTPLDSVKISVVFQMPTNWLWAETLLKNISSSAERAEKAGFELALDKTFMEFKAAVGSKDDIESHKNGKLRAAEAPTAFVKPAAPTGLRLVTADDPLLWTTGQDPNGDFAPPRMMGTNVIGHGFVNFYRPTTMPGITVIGNSDEFFVAMEDDHELGIRHILNGSHVVTEIRVNQLINDYWKARVDSNGPLEWKFWEPLCLIFNKPDICLKFSRHDNPESTGLTISAVSMGDTTRLIYSPSSNCLFLVWETTSLSMNWIRSKEIQTIPDLAESRLQISSSVTQQMYSRLSDCVRKISLQFGTSAIVLTNFYSFENEPWNQANAVLPSRKQLLSQESLQ